MWTLQSLSVLQVRGSALSFEHLRHGPIHPLQKRCNIPSRVQPHSKSNLDVESSTVATELTLPCLDRWLKRFNSISPTWEKLTDFVCSSWADGVWPSHVARFAQDFGKTTWGQKINAHNLYGFRCGIHCQLLRYVLTGIVNVHIWFVLPKVWSFN